MNGKFEEKLIRLAFEETSSKETSALERLAKSDPEAAKTLEEYRKVRIGLNLLTDVPPDQLSKERLSNAILGQGLKPLPAPTGSKWGWAWMPATAFALVFGMLTVRHLNRSSTPIVQIPNSTTVAFGTSLSTPAQKPAAKTEAHRAMVALASKSRKSVDEHVHTSERQSRFLATDPQDLRVAEMTKAFQGAISVVGQPKRIEEPTDVKPAPSTPTSANEASGKLASINTPVVVINPENDNSSGAPKATEVDGAKDVSLGG